jgi:hypothetical protein
LGFRLAVEALLDAGEGLADQPPDQREAAHEAVYNCLVAAQPAERLDGTMQEGFPIEAVRRLAEARAGLPEP